MRSSRRADRGWTGGVARWGLVASAVSPGAADGFGSAGDSAAIALVAGAAVLLLVFGVPWLVVGWQQRWPPMPDGPALLSSAIPLPVRALATAALAALLFGVVASLLGFAPWGGIALVSGLMLAIVSELLAPRTPATQRPAPGRDA